MLNNPPSDSKIELIPEDSNWMLALNSDLRPQDFGLGNDGPRADDVRLWGSLSRSGEAYAYDLCPLRDELLRWAQKRGIRADWVLDWALHTMHLWKVYGVFPKEKTCERSPSDFCSENCGMHCQGVLNTFDYSLIASDNMSQ